MLRHLSIGLLASAVAIAPLPLKAQDGSAEDLGDVMSISLKDVVKPTLGFQGALQGAGTPNQAGIGGFLPLSVSGNSVWFLDALINANFADREGESKPQNSSKFKANKKPSDSRELLLQLGLSLKPMT